MPNSTPRKGRRQSSTPAATPAKRAPTPRKPKRPKKPKPDFPLYAHAAGYWAKKVRGRVVYFTKWKDDPKGKGAHAQWLEQKDDLLAGREPRAKTDELVVGELCNQFLADKEAARDNGELSPSTFLTYHSTCAAVVKAFGRNRQVSDLAPDDFRKLRAKLAKTRGLVALGNAISRVRSIFKFGFDEGLMLAPPRYGQGFKKPKKERIDAAREHQRATHGLQMFEAHEIRLMLIALDGQEVTVGTDEKTGEPVKVTLNRAPALRAMVLLAANCGFGQTDLANLTIRAVNLETGWANFGRTKTGVPRRVWLWPETVDAIRAWLPLRPKAKDKADEGLMFLTRRGGRFVRLNAKGHAIDGVGQEFQKVLRKLNLKRPRLSVYGLRHGFETIAGETRDQVAVNAVMGHKDGTMAAAYRERIDDDRLRRVCEHVRAWLWPTTPDGGGSTVPQTCVPSELAYQSPVLPGDSGTQEPPASTQAGTHGPQSTQTRRPASRPAGDRASQAATPRPTLRIVG